MSVLDGVVKINQEGSKMDCTGISSGDGAWGEELSRDIVVAEKEYTCCECRKKIDAAGRYELYSANYDDGISEFKTCVNCLSLRNAFFDNWVFRCIWDDFYEHVSEGRGDEIKWSALSKLTEAAKDMAFDCIETVWERIEEGEEDDNEKAVD